MSSLKSQSVSASGAGAKGQAASIDLGKYRLGALLGKGAFGQVRSTLRNQGLALSHFEHCDRLCFDFMFQALHYNLICSDVQVYKGLNIESGEVVAVKQVQLNVINAEQLDSARPVFAGCIIVAFTVFFSGIMGEIALLKRLKSSRITRYMDSIKTKVRRLMRC
jgi:serine/threonine protein kinase